MTPIRDTKTGIAHKRGYPQLDLYLIALVSYEPPPPENPPVVVRRVGVRRVEDAARVAVRVRV